MTVQLPFKATPVAREQLRTRLGQELVQTAETDSNGFITNAELLRTATADLILLTLHPEVPSHPVNPIHWEEPIAFLLPDDPQQEPGIFALREDFPAVPHLIRPVDAIPGQLCLFDRPYAEYRARLSGQRLVEQTLLWLN